MAEFIGSIDQGTTSSRFLIFNKAGEPVASHQEVRAQESSLQLEHMKLT
jgi:glycerol kinase